MPVTDVGLTLMANALDAAITHMQLHSGAPGATGTTNQIGTRVACAFTSDADGDLTLDATVNFTGLTANGAVQYASLWSASTGGNCHATQALTGDATANAAGEYSVTALTINSTST